MNVPNRQQIYNKLIELRDSGTDRTLIPQRLVEWLQSLELSQENIDKISSDLITYPPY